MVGQEQLESSPLCQHSDNETETKRECSVVIPDDWQLTSQQQAFIELFAEDDQPKRKRFSKPVCKQLEKSPVLVQNSH